KIFEIRHASAPEMREARKDLVKAQRELRTISTADTFDEAAAQKQADAVAKAYAQIALLRAKDTNAIVAELTPEQRQQMEQRRQQREERFKSRRDGQRKDAAPAPAAAPATNAS